MRSNSLISSTLFLDIGCALVPDAQSQHKWSKTTSEAVYRESALSNDFKKLKTSNTSKLLLEEYHSLTIAFPEPDESNAGFRKIIPIYPDPQPDMIKLLTRLKSKYNLRLVIIGKESLRLKETRSRNPRVNQIVDFYISQSFLASAKILSDIITHVSFPRTRVELSTYGLWDF